MPRDGSYHYQIPAGTDGVTDQTIDSGRYNAFIHDVETDLNAPRPISAGGTGSNNATDAMVALGGEVANQVVTNYNTFPFVAGSFGSSSAATAGPVDGHSFSGICYPYTDPRWMTIEARDVTDTVVPGRKYVRQKINDVWGAWTLDEQGAFDVANTKVAKAGDTMSGNLTISKVSPALVLDKTASGDNSTIYGATAGLKRWSLELGQFTAESVGNFGSDFVLSRWDNAGAFLGTSLQIFRANGVVNLPTNVASTNTLSGSLTIAGGVGIAGAINAGSLVTTGSTTTGSLAVVATTTCSGSLTLNTGADLFVRNGNIYFQDNTKAFVFNATPSRFQLSHGIDINGNTTVTGTFDAGGITGSAITTTGAVTAGTVTATGAVTGNTVAATGAVTGSTVTATGAITGATIVGSTGLIQSKAPVAGNANFVVQDDTGTNKGLFYWEHLDNSVRMHHSGASIAVILSQFGTVTTANGMLGKRGYGGGYDNNTHNFFWTGTANEMWIDSTNYGNVQVVCDYRIKKDVVPLASTWNVVKALNPIVYTHAEFTPPSSIAHAEAFGLIPTPLFVDDDEPQWGFLAHELQETLLPSAAHGYKDSPNDIQTPNLLCVIAALARCLQEAMTRIEALEQRR